MAYQCPKCGGPVTRGSHEGAQRAGGLVGALLAAAFGGFECLKCGKVARSEFPPEVRSKMMMGSVILVIIGLVVLVGAIAIIIAINAS
ncbi:MAG: hypothetical protein RDV41_01985 [Planctomycetota bacterium]|nr:hypothetical protein [Planctomycetota bacterium]